MNLLLEIGTEEIPHWMIPGALKQLAALDLLGALPLVDATPRRLVVKAGGIPGRTPDQEQIIKGPPLTAGDKAAAGFAKKNGVDVSALQKTGDYYELKLQVPGSKAIDILTKTLPAAILNIQWPKTMYWGNRIVLLGDARAPGYSAGSPMDEHTTEVIKRVKPPGEEVFIQETADGRRRWAFKSPRFIRPIRWIVALLDDQVIPFQIGGIGAGRVTRGHRQLGTSLIPVTIENYNGELRKNFVLLSSHERRHKIETEAAALGAKIDSDLLETLTFITEYPTAIRGEFDPAFLELPAEVLTTVMRHHQKYFSVETEAGKLAPDFVAVMNTSGDPEGLVKLGNEKVLRARFNDARFFWNVDQQKKLEDRVFDLEKVTFHARLGSYFNKKDRTVAIVQELGGSADAQRAAMLAKTDLTTEMVKEFTELQGIVGGLYARAQGEPEPVWKAIYEHYQPVNMEDSIPETREGQIVSLADKLDTLRVCFRVGMVPTGSKDPFALRRAAQGVVKILAEGELDLNFRSLFEGPLSDFMLDRARYYFRDVRGFKYDEVNAVLAVGVTALQNVEPKLKWLADVRQTPDFEPLAASFKRINNILGQANFTGQLPLQHSLLEAGPETELYDAYTAMSQIGTLDKAIAHLRPHLDNFFNKVMVNVPDESVRLRRLALLHTVRESFSQVADFSEIVTSGEQK